MNSNPGHDVRDTLRFSAQHDITPISLDEAPKTLEVMATGEVRGRRVIVF